MKKQRIVHLTSGKVKPHACAACGTVMDGVTQIGNKVEDDFKKTGGIMLCACCGAYCVFVDETTTRVAGPQDLTLLDALQFQVLEKYRMKIVTEKAKRVEQAQGFWLGRGHL